MYISSNVRKVTVQIGMVLKGKCVGLTMDWCTSSSSGRMLVDITNMGDSNKVVFKDETISRGPLVEASIAMNKDGNIASIYELVLSMWRNSSYRECII